MASFQVAGRCPPFSRTSGWVRRFLDETVIKALFPPILSLVELPAICFVRGFIPVHMGWIQEHLRQNSQKSTSDKVSPEADFAAAAWQRWQELGRELGADAAEFNSHQPGV